MEGKRKTSRESYLKNKPTLCSLFVVYCSLFFHATAAKHISTVQSGALAKHKQIVR